MGLFDFFKNSNQPVSNETLSPALKNRLEEVTRNKEELEKQSGGTHYYTLQKEYALLPEDIAGKEDIVGLSRLLGKLNKQKNQSSKIQISLIGQVFQAYPLLKANLSDEEIHELVTNWKESDDFTFRWSLNKLFTLVGGRYTPEGPPGILEQTLRLLITTDGYSSSELRKLNQKIDQLLQKDVSVPLSKFDSWGKAVIDFIDGIHDENLKNNWIKLILHCVEAGEKSAPSSKWLAIAEKLLITLGHDEFKPKLTEWLTLNKDLILAIHKNEESDFLRDVNHNALKSLIWCSGFIKDNSFHTAIDAYAAAAYRKKPGTGPISAKTGTACMFAFSMLPFKEGITRLMKFRNKIVNNTILKSIDRIISEVAEKNGYSRDLVEEIGVMDFGLDENAMKRMDLGSVSCTIKVNNINDVSVQWEKDGKPQKSIPAIVKSEHAATLKELKNDVKEIETQLKVQKDRIESYYLKKKKWKYEDWIENYFLHPLVKIISSKLIWAFTKDTTPENGIFENGQFINVKGELISWINNDTEIELWHPVHSTVEEVVAWRNFIQQKEITQSFKQAYREIYVLTDAELKTNTYSNRFAAHILRQHQFAALCRQRGWQYHLMGQWDSHNTPSINIPHWKMRAEYFADSNWDGPANDLGIFTHIATDQVRFYKEGELQELVDVPPLVFTEIMRDVDLFVGVTSIGNDPAWTDTGDNRMNTYWREYSFGDLGESAKVRSEVLQKLFPRLKIASQCSFDGKYLIVKGQLRTYKIHMGSGNILMEPNDQYLCIVPESRTEKDHQKIYLPFEGDTLLSIIISKALLLAEDTKIRDETITRQIKT